MAAASAAAVDGISFEGLSPIDAAAFNIERADKDGDRLRRLALQLEACLWQWGG